MKQVEERYISLLTDFGFKRIFGTAMNKDLLADRFRLRPPLRGSRDSQDMLADGVDLNLIMKYSGLTQEQIEKLK